MLVRFGPIDKILLFGGAPVFASIAEICAQRVETVAICAPRHLKERYQGSSLEETLERLRVKFYEVDEIDKFSTLPELVSESTLGIAVGAAWEFNKTIASYFSEFHFLDLMGIDLPRYRGGAHYTWQILHANRTGCVNLQVIKGGRENFHKGPLLYRQEYRIPDTAHTPADYFEHNVPVESDEISAFLDRIEKGEAFELRMLDEADASYFPFLSTLSQGWVDWKWNSNDIVRFISAFDDPYPGASTFINGRRVHLKKATLVSHAEAHHPFTSGIIFRITDGIHVATQDGAIKICTCSDEAGDDIISQLELGSRLFTPTTVLDDALQFNAQYDSGGLRG